MSYVLDLVVFASIMLEEEEFLPLVNEEYGQEILRPISGPRSECYGGTCAMQATVAAGAIRSCDMHRLGAALRRAYNRLAEREDEFLQVAWQNEHDDGFQFHTLRSGDGPFSGHDQDEFYRGWSGLASNDV